jgi:hypothetical protein
MPSHAKSALKAPPAGPHRFTAQPCPTCGAAVDVECSGPTTSLYRVHEDRVDRCLWGERGDPRRPSEQAVCWVYDAAS